MTRSGRSLEGRVLVAGTAAAPALVLETPLSLWGGLDPRTGRVSDHHHPQLGATVSGRVLVMPSGRGSSSSSSVLAEAIRLSTAPLAILVEEPDEILVLGAIVADHLYARTCPVLAVAGATRLIATGDHVHITRDGTVMIIPSDRQEGR
jgi:uncharacterized protein